MTSLADQLAEATGPSWKRNPDGSYEGTGFRQGRVELKRNAKKVWIMVVAGKEYELGRRATFDTAERKLSTLP